MENLTAAHARTAQLDLAHVRRITASKYGWTDEKAAAVEATYRQYFALAGSTTSTVVPPSKDVDFMWHEHILFTRDYHRACSTVHGQFVHHSPMMDMTPEQETVAVAETVRLFETGFGCTPSTDFVASCCQGRGGEKGCCASSMR